MNRLLLCLLCLVCTLTAHATDWSKQLPLEHKSRYFDFHYQRPTWDAAGFARFADAFVDVVNRDFFKADYSYPIDVLVLPDRPSFQQFLRKEFGESDPPNFGMFFPAFTVFVTYEGSGYGTFAHEIVHPLLDRNLGDSPRWATEAIPAFFEKFIGYWDGDHMVVQWGYQNPWRIEALGDQLTKLDLKRLLRDQRAYTNFANSERRLLTVFLWQQGKFERFLQLIAARNHKGYRSYFEAAMERPLKDIEPLWRAYLTDIAAHRAEVMKIPGSVLFANQTTYEKHLAENHPWRQPPLTK